MQLIKDMQAAPSEADLMKDTIGVLSNSSAFTEEVLIALEALQVLVEPIDNANGMCSCISQHSKRVLCKGSNMRPPCSPTSR